MDPIFAWIEDSALSTFLRESPSLLVFPAIVTLHTIGMGFVAGTSAAIDLRVLGVARRIPLPAMERFLPVLWIALAVNIASGILLLIAYPTKALTNPVFYLKLTLIALGLFVLRKLRLEIFRKPVVEDASVSRYAMRLAAVSLVLWIAAITAGRLLAYTYKWELLGVRAIL